PRGHARGDVHGHAADVCADHLALAGVYASAHIDAERADVLPDRTRAADRARGTVERRQEAVAESLDLVPAERCELATHELVVVLEQRTPTVVAELCSALSRAGDVGEQHGRQHPVRLNGTSDAGEELLHLV